MTRVQILLTAEEDRRLEALAQTRRESKSSLVRGGLQLLFRAEAKADDALLGLIARAGRSGQRDAAERHDRVLTAAERRRSAR
jgi:hypothetical protein